MLHEACRVADTLELLDLTLRGVGPADDEGTEGRGMARVLKTMAERRQQQLVLNRLLADLRSRLGAALPATEGVTDELSRRRQARLSAASGE